jgi:uncharacterized protein with ParB-like and HNH nuclease domain
MGALAGTEKLGSIVQSFDLLSVEDYQRVYVWEESNIDDLFQDIWTTVGSPSDHFFGTLILEIDGDTGRKAKVVDGQQRLTTTMLIVAALRDEIILNGMSKLPDSGSSYGPDVLTEARQFLTWGNNSNNQRFHPNRLLRKVMTKCVLPEPGNQKQIPWGRQKDVDQPTNINLAFRKAIKHIRTSIKTDLTKYPEPEARLRRIYEILSTITQRFRVLKVTTTSVDESLEIFLTLNSRGSELQASDLARGEILKRLTDGLEDDEKIQIHEDNLLEWSSMGEQVQDLETFLRHYLVSTCDYPVTKKMILAEVTKRIDTIKEDEPHKSLNERAQDFWDSLNIAAIKYSEILNPNLAHGQLDLEMLNVLQVSHRVLFLNLFGTQAFEIKMAEVIKLTATLSFRWTLLGENAQDLETLFRKLGRAYVASNNIDTLLTQLQKEIEGLSPISASKWSRGRDKGDHARLLLYMIYVDQAGDGNTFDLKTLHLEHVAPQTATTQWKRDLSSSGEVDESDAYQDMISAAGNLTLLDPKINIKIKNIPFDEKKKKYSASKINLTEDIRDLTHWDIDVIKDRSQWLSEMFEVVWPIEDLGKKIVSYAEWQSQS